MGYFPSMGCKKDWSKTQELFFTEKPELDKKNLDGDFVGKWETPSFRDLWVRNLTEYGYFLEVFVFSVWKIPK